ncbi:MAG: sugar O-acetyltransferase [Lentisphaeria bacterium]|nr:sugar O-acetyltransferase [Lentisphaeria bacterium]
MTEREKMEAGLEFCFLDAEMDGRKMNAIKLCRELNALDPLDKEGRLGVIRKLFGSIGRHIHILPSFQCDNGRNIHVGEEFLANYNVTILDVAPVWIGDHCLLGPNTLITTINHPLSPKGRRGMMGTAKPVRIGNDVWIGGNCTILPGVTIGSNVVVAAGAVVTRDVPDNCLVAGVPAKVLKTLENDVG